MKLQNYRFCLLLEVAQNALSEAQKVNRKLIRPNLAEVKMRESSAVKESVKVPNSETEKVIIKPENIVKERTGEKFQRTAGESRFPRPPADSFSDPAKRKIPPPTETNAEIFYYKKQIDSRTLMVFILQDGEEIEGTIEWYDLHALKINRTDAPNIMLFKHNIKYMYKAEDEESES